MIFIIAMFIESKNCSKSLMLVKVILHDFNCLTDLNDFSILLNENDFSLSWVITEEKDLFNIWVKVKLFCFIIVFSLKRRTVERELKFENWRKSIYIFITKFILFIHIFSKIIWCCFNWVINIKAMFSVWFWIIKFK